MPFHEEMGLHTSSIHMFLAAYNINYFCKDRLLEKLDVDMMATPVQCKRNATWTIIMMNSSGG